MLTTDELKKVLTTSGFVNEADFNSALEAATDVQKPVTDILVFRGLISDDALGKLIAEYYKVGYVNLKNKIVPLEILKLVPEQAALSFHIIPFHLDKDYLSLAMENPQDIEAVEFVKRKTNLNVIPFYLTPSDFAKTVGQYKRNIKNIFQTIIEDNVSKTDTKIDNIEGLAEEVPVIKILDTILEYAQAEGASDVHINALEDSMVIRFRVDGILKDIVSLPKPIHPALIARIKILSSLKIDEHRTPQDGRFKFKVNESFVALRVSVLPTFFGENIVMRLLPESARALSLEELGVGGDQMALVLNNIKKPHGMVLVTGPTGSGKTTTLYSILNILNTPKVNICTIEDPIEYSLRRVNQTQVNQQAGLTFATGLRSLLRHDPNVIMIGEIRDSETAEIAIHSALTGHLVLSTLHTNSATGAIPRFLDMGSEAFLLASTLNVIIAQRLVRRICAACIQKIEVTQEIREFIETHAEPSFILSDVFRGTGCPECGNSGYKGRISIYEMLEITKEIRDLITHKASEEALRDLAVKQGMVTLIRDGINKVGAGLTTIEEIIRVTRE